MVSMKEEERPLAAIPTWAVAIVMGLIVAVGSFFHVSLNHFGKGFESFASYESLEQLHRLLFTLGITHVSYSMITAAFAIVKIYSWRRWEIEAISLSADANQETHNASPTKARMRRLTTFVSKRTSHPWSQHEVLVWMLCFIRQFWSSINKSDYNALRYGFIIRHELPLSYDFHNYMLRSMDEEFRDIVGVSLPLWIYAILCIFLDFHGTKLHHIVVKLAVEIQDSQQWMESHELNLRDELFWFGKPWILLRLIQFISFQHHQIVCVCPAERVGDGYILMVTLGNSGSFLLHEEHYLHGSPLGVRMGCKFKRTVISETVRRPLHGWKSRVKGRRKDANSASTSHVPLIRFDIGDVEDPVASSSKGLSSSESRTPLGYEDKAWHSGHHSSKSTTHHKGS